MADGLPVGDDELRRRYTELIDALLHARRAADARACAELAVAQGLWTDPSQRPLEHVPGLAAQPLCDASELWFADHLEESAERIRQEVERAAAAGAGGFRPVDEPLVGAGRWDQVVLYEGGRRQERACEAFPVTAAVVDEIPEATTFGPGVVTLSWLHPGTHIVPHCGWSNARLRVHLGLLTPPGARMRVGDTTVTWELGRCVVFDDSFEHEVWHDGDEPRVVLLLDVFNPRLDEQMRERLLSRRTGVDASIRAYMLEHGVDRIAAAGDELAMRPSERVASLVRRYMDEVEASAVELNDERLRYER